MNLKRFCLSALLCFCLVLQSHFLAFAGTGFDTSTPSNAVAGLSGRPDDYGIMPLAESSSDYGVMSLETGYDGFVRLVVTFYNTGSYNLYFQSNYWSQLQYLRVYSHYNLPDWGNFAVNRKVDSFVFSSSVWSSSTVMPNCMVVPVYVQGGTRLIFDFPGVSSLYNYGIYRDRVCTSLFNQYSGLYDSSDRKVSKTNVRFFSDAFAYTSYPVCLGTGNRSPVNEIGMALTNSGVYFKKGYEYTVVLYHEFPINYVYSYGMACESSKAVYNDGYTYFSFVPSVDTLVTDPTFVLHRDNPIDATGYLYGIHDITSSYIPAGNTDEMNQNINNKVSQISSTVTNISNTITNISNQITNMTTTITNTIHNMANQITGAVNQQTNSLNQNADKNTDKVTQNQNQNTDKITNNQNQNTDKITDNQNQNTDKITGNADENTNKLTEKLEDVKVGIIEGIIEGLKSLFIPSDDFFKDWFDDIYQFFSDRLGFLMLPIDLLVNMVNLFMSADASFAGIPFPEFKWTDGTVIIPAQNVRFEFLDTEWGKDIQNMLYFVGNVIMIGALLSLMHRKLEGVLNS